MLARSAYIGKVATNSCDAPMDGRWQAIAGSTATHRRGIRSLATRHPSVVDPWAATPRSISPARSPMTASESLGGPGRTRSEGPIDRHARSGTPAGLRPPRPRRHRGCHRLWRRVDGPSAATGTGRVGALARRTPLPGHGLSVALVDAIMNGEQSAGNDRRPTSTSQPGARGAHLSSMGLLALTAASCRPSASLPSGALVATDSEWSE